MKCTLPFCSFPSVHWILLARIDGAVIDIHEHYVKQTYRNRYDILCANGRVTLTIPVESQKGQKIPMREIRIAEGNWRKLHFASIKSGYGRAAYFEHYISDLEKIFLKPQVFLVDFNFSILEWISDAGINLDASMSDVHIEDPGKDFRPSFEPSSIWPPLPSYLQVFSDRFPFQSTC